MTTALTIAYLLLFNLCAWPAVARIVRRRSSEDLSLWREGMLLTGIACQFAVFVLIGIRDWRALVSPISSGISVAVLLTVAFRFRRRAG